MKDNIRRDLEKLCHSILAHDDDQALPHQLTQVQMLYERLLVLNYLNEKELAQNHKTPEKPEPQETKTSPAPAASAESSPEPKAKEKAAPSAEEPKQAPMPAPKPPQPAAEPKPLSRESEIKTEEKTPRQNSLNDRLARGTIEVGLNDRLAFVKHLFGGQQEDFNRVLSQLNTAGNYHEAADFLQNLVKPEYNWDDKEEYEERLLELIRQKFGEEND